MDTISYEPIGVKKYLGWYATPLLIGVILALLALAFWYGESAWKLRQDTSGSRQISVSGKGKISVRPDVAQFNASVITSAPRIGDAQRENAKSGNAVLAFLKGRGIEEKDIKTIGYSINPQYQYFDNPPCSRYPCPLRKPPEIISYEVRNTLQIKVRSIDKVDDILEGVVENGANEVGSISFTVDEPDKIKAGARKMAIDDAKTKAKVLAQDLGVRLGKIVNFSESGGEIPVYYRSYAAEGMSAPKAAPAPEVEPGEQEIQVMVSITYEFR